MTNLEVAQAQSQLETMRDRELQEILLQTQESTQQPLLTEKSSQLNQLRRNYIERLNRPDWAAELQLENRTGLNASPERFFSGISARAGALLQFSENWQTQSAWSFSVPLTNFSPLLYRTASELPSLESIELTYGKMRSVSLSAGLPQENSLLLETNTKALFSGLSVAIHPLEQRLNSDSLRTIIKIEHGWTSLLPGQQQESKRTEIERTRPQLMLSRQFNEFNIRFNSTLEWYSDSSGQLGKITGFRPNADLENVSSSENNWRLFTLRSQLDWRSQESKTHLAFERISNTIGSNSTPAWSVLMGGEIQWRPEQSVITGLYKASYYRTPSGAVPSFRLPLEVNPGTQGVQMSLELKHFFLKTPNSTYSIEFTRSLKRSIETSAWNSCSKKEQSYPRNCHIDWVTLAWALKLPTNL